ncbi:MAG: hypothetical protein J4F97_06095 [Pseudomonadales bacterium]|nr:hypothetical protein [Pseudomonadales bacterium]
MYQPNAGQSQACQRSAMGRFDWEQYRSNMFDGGFVCSMDPEGVQHLP